jgi:hypothetical protein
MTAENHEIEEDYVRVVAPDDFHVDEPPPGLCHVVSPLFCGIEIKRGSPTRRLCARIGEDEKLRCSMTGVAVQIAADFWAWRGQWAVFLRCVAASALAQEYILSIEPVHRESFALARLERAQSIVRSLIAAQVCAEALADWDQR